MGNSTSTSNNLWLLYAHRSTKRPRTNLQVDGPQKTLSSVVKEACRCRGHKPSAPQIGYHEQSPQLPPNWSRSGHQEVLVHCKPPPWKRKVNCPPLPIHGDWLPVRADHHGGKATNDRNKATGHEAPCKGRLTSWSPSDPDEVGKKPPCPATHISL